MRSREGKEARQTGTYPGGFPADASGDVINVIVRTCCEDDVGVEGVEVNDKARLASLLSCSARYKRLTERKTLEISREAICQE